MSNLPPIRHQFKLEAVQLKIYPYGESDHIVSLLSREYGLLRAIAKGSQKPRSKISGLIAPLRINELLLIRGKSLHRIIQAQTQRSLVGLQDDYDRLMSGFAIAELLVHFCQEEDAQPELYDVLSNTLSSLSKSEIPLDILLWFLIYLLENQGFYIDFESCQACERSFTDRDYHFLDLHSGALLCNQCKVKDRSQFLNLRQIQSLRQVQRADRPMPLELKEHERKQILASLQQVLQHILEHPLKCFQFIFPATI